MTKYHWHFRGSLCAVAVLAAGCAAHRAATGATAKAIPVQAASEAEPDMRGLATRTIPELGAVHFAYDSSSLDAASLRTLRANAAWLKSRADVRVQVAGHCDQRGTVAYNLALGQRRAAAVREYYKALGIAAGRVATISYGKERPLCGESGEDCWSRNRRAETLQAEDANMAGEGALRVK